MAIPYIGYLELDVELCGKLMTRCGVLVVKDPPEDLASQVPGVLGMNVIRRCYGELFGQHGLALFELPLVSEAPESVVQALQKCHQASVQAPQEASGKVKVRGRKACCIPGGVMKIVAEGWNKKMVGSNRTQKRQVTITKGPPELGPHSQGITHNRIVYWYLSGEPRRAGSEIFRHDLSSRVVHSGLLG